MKRFCTPCAKARSSENRKAWLATPAGKAKAKATRQAWDAANKEDRKAKHDAWRKSPRGRELVKAQYHRFHAAHPEKHREYSARNYAKNGAKQLAKRRQQIKDNPEFWRAYFKARYQREKLRKRGTQMPEPGEAFNARLYENELFAKVIAAIPRGLDDDMRKDVASATILAIIECGSADHIPAKVKVAMRDHRRMFDRYKTVSIDAPIYAGSNRTIGDNLTYPEARPAT
ncbi:MAG: hypothetical protein Q8M24_14620 [Pseudolabrys sp.]|nr:hypothetical protein [Pseudolabrys sp.]MDP2296682.1 hypothetical protein [Pseudolabrys sp.]